MTSRATSPAASGPAGPHFEGQVGAYYLLSLLTASEPRGLPGTAINRIEFQRAAEGRPLDDIIVRAHDSRGNPAVIEIQVKRNISFTSSDQVFRAVVGQIVKASGRPDFWRTRYELAISIARTSRKIDGAYQDVLTWARQLSDAETFMARIERPGSANPDMRTFVDTFKSHLRDFGSPNDDEAVWRLLRRLQILIFDFTAQGSATEELVKERAVHALHPDNAPQAGNLWTTLIELALKIALSGGDRTRDRLINELVQKHFRLADLRYYTSVRANLAEASRNALADISDSIGGVKLTRHKHIGAVHSALDKGRYIEIRGDAGVGKSVVLKHFAEQIASEAGVIVLSPGRTTLGGWNAMRAVLGFDGTAHELLSDLACNGGAVLFIDNLDFFSDAERRTVVDLVREAPGVPGISVIATARRDFGHEEPNWLPPDVLSRLRQVEPILISELSKSEVEEIRQAVPSLTPLLANNHPAHHVTRNLFRLARLASQTGNEPVPHTEVDMAEQWWQTADGRKEGRRERARLLKGLAERALVGADPLSVSDLPAKAVDALIAGETLRDLGNDRVAFRHDVLREWAIANLLYSEPTMIERLPLDHPAQPDLARGAELAARMALEREADSTGWKLLVDRLSGAGTHGSWRRAALLAVVRSEIGYELLTRISSILLGDRASILRELIRTVMAVEVKPASKVYAAVGVDPALIPAGINVPTGPSWYRLIAWLIGLGQSLPAAAIPDVVDLYTAWSIGLLGRDPFTPLLLPWLYRWLIEIEETHHPTSFSVPFGGEFDRDRLASLESNLRSGFLLFCDKTPTLAIEYLRSLRNRHNDSSVRSVLKFRGSLAQAAPAELADLTAAVLIGKNQFDEEDYRDEYHRPFGFLDNEFLPVSPAQGPFLDLLIHAPQHGLSLIHRLVDHAITFYSVGREYGENAITIAFSDGERAFPWAQSYAWTREWTAGHYCITSALMALETWAHRRIEAGEDFDEVLADVLGPPGSQAAYLLVAVDLLLSHWPKSCEAAVPFLGCPELLCIDRERHMHDNFKHPDFFGFKALQKEPAGTASLESLRSRHSRRFALEQLLGNYVEVELAELRGTLTEILLRAAVRLGSPDKLSTLADPRLMVVHALNRVDLKNWQKIQVTLSNGTQSTVPQYVPPETENRHFARLQEAAKPRTTDFNMRTLLSLVLEDPSRSSSEFATAAVEWAQKVKMTAKTEDEDEDWMREQAVITAAMIAIRDGYSGLRKRHIDWARSIFTEALQTKEDPVHRFRSGLRYNPIAIAFAGLIHLLKHCADAGIVRIIFKVAASGNPAAAHGFGASAVILASIDERLPRAVLRCAFMASIRPTRNWELSEEEVAARSERQRQRVENAVDAELAWLAGERPEPEWPAFPLEPPRQRQRMRIPGGGYQQDRHTPKKRRPEEHADHQAAALWLGHAGGLFDIVQRPWITEIARTYASWTYTSNGIGLDVNDKIYSPPSEWNDAYFNLMARCLPSLTLPEIEQVALDPINSLPDEAFFDIIAQFMRCVDAVYFNDCGLQEPIAISVRAAFANRLIASRGWSWLAGDRSHSIELHIGPAIAAIFFNDYDSFQPAKCYLLPKAVERLDPFVPVLEKLVESGPSYFVAVVTLNLLEVSPKAAHLPFIISAAKTWLKSYHDDSEFWVDHGLGRRVCIWIENVLRQQTEILDIDKPVRPEVDRLLAALISLGVPEARRLEETLARGQKAG